MEYYVTQPKDYWIAQNAVNITLNALGDKNRIQCSVVSGAVIMCFLEDVKPASQGGDPENGDGLYYGANHEPKRWPLSISPTYFNNDAHKYVYVAIPRSEAVGTQAVIVFPSEELDIYGRARRLLTSQETGEPLLNEDGEQQATYEQIGSTDYFYIYLNGIISAPAVNAGTGREERGWERIITDWGKLETAQGREERQNSNEWFTYSQVNQVVTFLKEIVMGVGSSFRNLILNHKNLTDVATSETDYTDSDTMVATPGYVEKHYLSKSHDDSTPYSLTVGGNLSVGGILRAATGYFTSLYSNLVRSTNYTGDGIADTGYRLTADDGTGSSALTVDNLHVRKKATFEELEVKKETAVAGNEVRSAAANVINRTDYYDENGNILGYSYRQVPWLLKKMPFLLRGTFFGRLRKIRIELSPEDATQIARIRCYFLAKDNDRDVKNLWKADNINGHDLVRCQTFNLNSSRRYTYINGEAEKIGDVFWWRKAIAVSSSPVNIEGQEYHYVDVSNLPGGYAANSDIPAAGDNMVQFGNDSNSQRMNLIIQEINGTDAPAVKAYTGIYTFDLNKCWWGGSPRKMMLSPTQGYEFYGPSFKFVQEYGVKPAAIDRGAWSEIATERDDYGQHAQVRKCYYYDKVTHKGCYWLCVMSNVGAHWVADENFTDSKSGRTYEKGDVVDNYDALSSESKEKCSRKENYITAEPGTNDAVWQKQVDRGTSVKSVTSYYAKQTAAQYTGEPPTSGWQSSIAAVGTLNEGDYLWTKSVTTYSDTLEDTTTYTVSKWGIDGDGIENIETKFYEDSRLLEQEELSDKTIVPESSWVEYNQLSLKQGDYIYTRTRITYDKGGTPTVSYQINRIGQDGVSYLTTEEYYCLGNSMTTPPTGHPYQRNDGKPEFMTPAEMAERMKGGNWSESRPTYQGDANKYIWNFEVSYDTTTNVQVTQPLCIGDYSKGISTIVETYTISSHPTKAAMLADTAERTAHPWVDEVQDSAPTDELPYQWNKTVTSYSDGTSDTFYHVSAVKGTRGRGISNTNIYYKADSSTPATPSGAPAQSGWSDDGNTLITKANSDDNKHLYESTCTTFTDGNYAWTTPLDDGLISDMASTEEEFALADSGTTAPTSEWRTSVTPTAGKWVWSRTKLTFKSGTPLYKYINTQCVGYCGTDGDSITIDDSNTFIRFAKSATHPPLDKTDSRWKQTIAELNLSAGDVYWTWVHTAYSDGASTDVCNPGYYGIDGTSPYFVDIDNEMDSMALDASGKTTAAYSKTVKVRIWHGSTEMTLTDIVISGTTTNVTATKNVANKTVTISVDSGKQIDDITELTIIPKATGAPNDQSVHFVLNGIRPGANGSHATVYNLVPDVSEIVMKKNGTFSPVSFKCHCSSLTNGTATDNPSEATMEYSYNGTNWTAFTASTTFSSNTINTNGGKLYLQLKVGTKVMDKETIPVVADGENGIGSRIETLPTRYAKGASDGSQPTAAYTDTSIWKNSIAATNPAVGDYIWSLYGTTPISIDKNGQETSGTTIWIYGVDRIGADGTKGYSMHTAYADSISVMPPTSKTQIYGFSTTMLTTSRYIGICVKQQESTTGPDPDPDYDHALDYEWSKFEGPKGTDAPYYVEDYGIGAYRTSHDDISDWSPNQPTPTEQKPYVWKRSRLYNPNTQTYGNATYVCLTGEKGVNGKDGWMVTANPANVIITQALGNDTTQFSTVKVDFTAKKGSVPATVSSLAIPTGQQALSNEFNAAIGTGDDAKKVIVSSPKTYTPQGGTAQYYTEGAFVVDVIVTDPDTGSGVTFNVTVPCYANLLGTWKRDVEDGTETVIAEKLSHEIFGDDVHTIEQTGQYVRGWGENTSVLTKKVDNGKNLLSGVLTAAGWKSGIYPTFNNDAKVDENDWIKTLSGHYNLKTPVFTLSEGTYTLSLEANSSVPCIVCKSSDNSILYELTLSGSGRKKATFRLSSSESVYIAFSVYSLRYPQLEIGSTATDFDANTIETSSRVKQTADSIELKVKNTGVDIEEGIIKATTDKFEIRNSNDKTTFSVDRDGNIVGSGSASFKGSIITEGKAGDGQGKIPTRWEITPLNNGIIGIPQITGFDTNGNPVLWLNFDGNLGDSFFVPDGGGMYFNNGGGHTFLSSRYARQAWRVNCPNYGEENTTTHQLKGTYIEATTFDNAGCHISFLNKIVDGEAAGQTKNLIIGADNYGALLRSESWPTSAATTTGRVYKDDWGYLKVKDTKTYDRINVKTSSFELPKDPPIGTMFFVKRVLNDITIKTSDAYVLNGSNNGTLWEPNKTYNWDDTHSMVLFYLGEVGTTKYWTMIYSS